MKMRIALLVLFSLLVVSCESTSGQDGITDSARVKTPVCSEAEKTAKTVHVFVALCDNESQGIVPVSDVLGNGDDPQNNLYWGAMYGVKTFLGKRDAWTLVVEEENLSDEIVERIIFQHSGKAVYLVADAYRGSNIKKAVIDFLRAAGGNDKRTFQVGEEILGLNGAADLIVYVGHNGLMDFDIERQEPISGDGNRQAIVLACKSKDYFQSRLVSLGCKPVLLTTGFMAPEAYTLDAAVSAWILGEPGETIKEQAAIAYNKYQKCGLAGARRLFFSGE